jgi:putative phosphoribosyl transferase
MAHDPGIPVYRTTTIKADGVELRGELSLPPQPVGLVIFAHGSGSSRLSARNIAVARLLNASHIGTLLFDLLTSHEDRLFANRFDIPLLTARLNAAVDWARSEPTTRDLPIALFGASTGAAAAIKAADLLGDTITSVVSRGGRPDLAGLSLSTARSPTLLLVGARDTDVEELNRNAIDKMVCEREIKIIPGATHLFEEPGTLDIVSLRAAEWFLKHFKVSERQLRHRPPPSENIEHRA